MKIEEKFQELRKQGEGAFMPHIYYGDPTEEFSLKEIKDLAENGADLIEFGIPFSDPTADGPTFQAACERALENGTTPAKCIQGIGKVRERGLKIPIIVTTYYNIPYAFGVESFLEEVKEAGAQGIIVPNLPIQEAGHLSEIANEAGIEVIFQIAPTTPRKRLKRIASSASGFLYIINVEGVTGARDSLANATADLINRAKKHTNVPLMAGFGISKKEHAKSVVSKGADGVIAGSALAEIYGRSLENPDEMLPELRKFSRKIKEGCIEGHKKRDLP